MVDDVRLSQQPAPRMSRSIRNQTRPIKGIDTQSLLGQASKVVDRQAKAKDEADKVFERDFRNRNKIEMYKSWAKIAQADKLEVHRVRAEENKRLNEFRDSLLSESNLDEAQRQRLTLGVGTDRLPYEKFGILHTSKETEDYINAINNKSLELETKGAVMAIGDDDAFGVALDRVAQSAVTISASQGFDTNTQSVDGIKAQGNAVIASMKSASEMQNFDQVRSLFDKYQSTFVTSKQLDREVVWP